jgi:hypothetical protein
MNVVGLDSTVYNLNLTGLRSHGRMQNKSDLHLQARKLINSIFPTMQVLEEVPINIRRNEILYLDFYLPLTRTCVEVHGEQHYRFIKFYHQSIMGFAKSKKRDDEKSIWCSVNNIKQIILPYNESLEQWRLRIIND